MTQLMERAGNSLEIIHPFVDSIAARNDVQITGGLSTLALSRSDVEIDSARKEVRVPAGIHIPAFREDGTKRDVDVLVQTSDKGAIEEVEAALRDTVGDSLERSVFGVRPNEVLAEQIAHPLGLRALRTFISDRYESSEFNRQSYVKSLFPFSVPIDPATLETWSMYIGSSDIPIPISHPSITITNYAHRAISGLRPRHQERIARVSENVFEKSPEMKEWLIDGPGNSQLELTRLVTSLRVPGKQNVSLGHALSFDTLSHAELAESPYFMNPERSRGSKRRIIAEAALKACLMHRFESSPAFLTFWHKYLERRSDLLVKNL